MTGPETFKFLGRQATLEEVGWDGPGPSKLWRYNQHYFEDLISINAGQRERGHRILIHHWIQHNKVGEGVGWESYPVSLRIVNWIKWALNGHELDSETSDSLAEQIRWLQNRLEIHLGGNHLVSNAKALVFGGLFYDGKEADQWLQKGLKILQREISEQVLPDGGHYERSTMYHALALIDFIDLCNISNVHAARLTQDHVEQLEVWRATCRLMLNWLSSMSHPDGEISFFNDAAMRVAPAPREIARYYRSVIGHEKEKLNRAGLQFLSHSGYARLTNNNLVLIADIGPVGPDHLPGHAHADTLSFEFSLHGQRVLVNSGTSTYDEGAERLRQRGSAAHNTLVVNGENSSEIWKSFRVARRAYPSVFSVTDDCTGTLTIDASHDGYKRFSKPVEHRRVWTLQSHSLTIYDTIVGAPESVEVYFHFHPSVRVVEYDGVCSGKLVINGNHIANWKCDALTSKLEQGSWHPEFGLSIANSRLRLVPRGTQCTITFDWWTQGKAI